MYHSKNSLILLMPTLVLQHLVIHCQGCACLLSSYCSIKKATFCCTHYSEKVSQQLIQLNQL